MWNVRGLNLSMTEEDFGVQLPVEVKHVEFSAQDSIKLVIKDKVNGTTILEKDFPTNSDNTFNLLITSEDTSSLPIGKYAYRLDWYHEGTFMYCLVEKSVFEVVDKT